MSIHEVVILANLPWFYFTSVHEGLASPASGPGANCGACTGAVSVYAQFFVVVFGSVKNVEGILG